MSQVLSLYSRITFYFAPILLISITTVNIQYRQDGESSDVTTNRNFAYIGPHLRLRNAILGHSLYDLGQGTGNKVICSSMQLLNVLQ